MKYDECLLVASLASKLFRKHVVELANSSKTIGYYTPHAATHFRGVENSVLRILEHHQPGSANQHISSLEHLILSLCSWSHDVGMIEEVAKKYYEMHTSSLNGTTKRTDALSRQNHDRASAWFLVTQINDIYDKIVKGLTGELHGTNAADFINLLTDEFSDINTDNTLRKVLQLLTEKEYHSDLRAQLTNLAYTANIVSRYHRRAEDIDKTCPAERSIFGTPVRTKLLAAIFRLADAIDVDRSRFSPALYESYRFMEDFDPESRLHWMKSFVVSSIAINIDEKIIEIQVDVPSDWESDSSPRDDKQQGEAKQLKSKVDEMVSFITSDLEEDVLSTSKILLDHGFPPIMGVTPRIHKVPAMELRGDILRTISNLAAASSPSTSRLIIATLDGLSELCNQIQKGNIKDEKDLSDHLNIRISSIEDQVAKRPCHEGLRKAKSMIQAIRDLCWDEDPTLKAARFTLQKVLHPLNWNSFKLYAQCLRYGLDTFNEQRKMIKTHVAMKKFDQYLKGYQDVILYGCSDQAIMLLEQIKNLNAQLSVHVLECRTKTRYTQSNRLIYHDAYRYATLLREQLGRGPNIPAITIYPDAAVARILQDTGKTLVLFGSNAILSNGAFLHSMGHLSVAAAARCRMFQSKTTVAVVTDGMKIAIGLSDTELASEGHQKRTKRREGERKKQRNENNWLSSNRSVVENLAREDISLVNYMEDEVPAELLDKIFILDRGICLDLESGKIKNIEGEQEMSSLNKYSFDAGQELADLLQRRFAASALAEISNLWPNIDPMKDAKSFNDKNWDLAKHVIDDSELPNDISQQARPQIDIICRIFRDDKTKIAIGDFGQHLNRLWRNGLVNSIASACEVLC